MKYDFDQKIDRKNNHSAKWQEINLNYKRDDLLPMWIADMDIKVAPFIIEAMKNKLEEGVFGYVYRPQEYYETASGWTKRRFNYDLEPKTLIHSPGVVPSLSLLVRLMSEVGDKILIQSPVYYPFSAVIRENKREVIYNNLIKDENNYYTIDFEDFEKKIVENNVKLFILCSPHNPVGRVWKVEELSKMANICVKHNVRIIADEIWRDLVMPGNKHIPLASISKEIENNTITCFSPTKSFNLAGLQASFVSFPRREDWEKFDKELGILDIKRNSPFSLVGFAAAYSKGDEWIDELVLHINSNMDYVIDYVEQNIPEIKICKPEATYLMWLDFSSLNMENEELSNFIQDEVKIAMDDGFWFGKNGGGFERINVACPRYIVEEGMKRIKNAIKKLRK